MIDARQPSDASSSTMSRLRADTAQAHAALEALPLMAGLSGSAVTRAHYARVLARLHGVYAPLEPLLADPAVPVARKTPLLRADLAALGHPPDADCPPPPLAGRDARLGALYVLEGATLGGRVLKKHLDRHLGAGLPMAFYDVYGAETGTRWRAFSARLEVEVADPEAASAGARAVFDSLCRRLGEAG